MADRLLLRDGTVLTVDSDLGDLPQGDVLIEGDTIAQVAPADRLAAQVEVQMGHDWPPVMKAYEHGLRPSLSIGVVTTVPGEKADVVLLDATALNMAPVIDPVAAVTLSADVSNVDTVLVDGQVKKRDGKLVGDVERALRLVEASRDYLVQQAEQKRAEQAQQA